MHNTRTTVLCSDHRHSLERASFDTSLYTLWENLSSSKTAFSGNDLNWEDQVGLFLAQQFGYCTGTISYFREFFRVQDILVAPTSFGREISHMLSAGQAQALRKVFEKGRQGEPSRQLNKRQGLAFPRKTEFEKQQQCILSPDGEVSYFSLFYIWHELREKYVQQSDSFFRKFIKEWMFVLGLLSSHRAPTTRLIRMLFWIQESHTAIPQRKKSLREFTANLLDSYRASGQVIKTSNSQGGLVMLSHSLPPLSQRTLVNLIDLLYETLNADLKKENDVGKNMLGLLAQRVVSIPEKDYGIENIDIIRKYISTLPLEFLDMHCTDRSDIAIPLASNQPENNPYPIYYFANHLGVTALIQAVLIGVDSARKTFNQLKLSLSALCGPWIASEVARIEYRLQEEKLEKEIGDAVAHDLTRSIYEGLAISAYSNPIKKKPSISDPEIESALINTGVQRQILHGMFATPWLQRQRQKGVTKVKWAGHLPESSDAWFWQKTIAYNSAALLFAQVNPIMREQERLSYSNITLKRNINMLKEIHVDYLFTSDLFQKSERQIITPDPALLYKLMMKAEELSGAQSPWPCSAVNLSDVMEYEGQKAILLVPVREALRNAIKHVTDGVRTGELEQKDSLGIQLSVHLSSSDRLFNFRIANFINPSGSPLRELPPSLMKIQRLMNDNWVMNLSSDNNFTIIEAILTCH